MNQLSQTQISNIATFAGLAVILLNKFGIIGVSTDQVTFIFAAVWTVSWNIYNYIQRYKKGDVTVLGARI